MHLTVAPLALRLMFEDEPLARWYVYKRQSVADFFVDFAPTDRTSKSFHGRVVNVTLKLYQ